MSEKIPLTIQTPAKPESEPHKKLSEILLGYDNPRMSEILEATEGSFDFKASSSPGVTSLCGSNAEMVDSFLAENINRIKSEVQGGIFVDAGCGDYPDLDAAERFGIDRVVGIDLVARSADSPDPRTQPSVEDSVDDVAIEGGRRKEKIVLRIGDEIIRGIARMQSGMVDIVYMRAMDVFEGDEQLCLEEIHRVLKDNGYLIVEHTGPFRFRNTQEMFESIAKKGGVVDLRILKKKSNFRKTQ